MSEVSVRYWHFPLTLHPTAKMIVYEIVKLTNQRASYHLYKHVLWAPKRQWSHHHNCFSVPYNFAILLHCSERCICFLLQNGRNAVKLKKGSLPMKRQNVKLLNAYLIVTSRHFRRAQRHACFIAVQNALCPFFHS